jgi:hypothetical protein
MAGQDLFAATPPTGFAHSLGISPQVATSTTAGVVQWAQLQYWMPVAAMQDWMYGTPDAVTTTLSFRVRSSVIGLYGGSTRNWLRTYSFAFQFVIKEADVWQSVSIVIPGAVGGDWSPADVNSPKDEAIGFSIGFVLQCSTHYSAVGSAIGAWSNVNYLTVAGQTNLAAVANSTFYMTGVQLERGNVPTAFDVRPADLSTTLQNLAVSTPAFRNRVVNGHMQLDASLRNLPVTLSASGQVATTGWTFYRFGDGVFSAQIISPENTLTQLGGSYYHLSQPISVGSWFDMGWGGPFAQAVTLSFWLRTSQSGNWGGTLRNAAPGTVATRVLSFKIGVLVSNQWQRFQIPLLPDTKPDNWALSRTLNSTALHLSFALMTHSGQRAAPPADATHQLCQWSDADVYSPFYQNNLGEATGNTWMITGVQLEKGTEANMFDWKNTS